MYKVALVDDDVLVLEFMEKMIPWNQYGFEVLGSFKDSVVAYEHLKQHPYDVLITDIGMPRLNGIELISLLRKNDMDTFKIILSCHDEFYYAQQALKLEVFDYILKESMDQENIVDLLKRLKVTIDKKRQTVNKTNKIEYFLKQNNMKLKTQFIEKLMEDKYANDDVWLREQGELLGMKFSSEHYTPILCFIDKHADAITKFEKEPLLQFSIDNIISETLKKIQKDVQIFYLKQKFYIIFPHDNQVNEVDPMIERALREIHIKLESYLKITITSVIGKRSPLRKGLVESMRELLHNEVQRFYYSNCSIQYLKMETLCDQPAAQNYMKIVQETTKLMIQEDEQQVEVYLKEQLSKLKQKRHQPPIVQDWAIKFILDIKLNIQALANLEDKNFITMTDKIVDQLETFEQLEEMIFNTCKLLMSHLESIHKLPHNSEVVKAQKFVLTRINQKITLSDVANYLHLNPSYFSRLFKKVTGESFVEYVTRVKMERAKEMLDITGKTIDQISFDLGFDSKSYFLKVFKKFYGMPPRAYKYKEVQINKLFPTLKS
ncbi:response regulator transcription factor [Salipaludibacillus sp. CF4.18]|uniref:response regulator transcription factor n=1 Tax=Salipaludibacillus sp. CF4.18 TaxID=3373081 RepID=UPI003EE80C2B